MSHSSVVVDETSFEDYQRVCKLVDATNKEKPKPADLKELRSLLATSPKLWRVAGNAAHLALSAAINSLTVTPFVRESLNRGAEVMREGLGYEAAPVCEQLLIDQVVLCWVRLHLLELAHNTKLTASHTTEAGLYWERRLSMAQRRFTRASESLAKVRVLTSAARLADERAETYRQSRPAQVRQLRAAG